MQKKRIHFRKKEHFRRVRSWWWMQRRYKTGKAKYRYTRKDGTEVWE